jgi:lycopene cyclase domain-containing protein
MSYFGFLAQFLGIPILLLVIAGWIAGRRGQKLTPALGNAAAGLVVAVHVVIALLYTTPWDNYLVATRVWWYDPALVTGITIGWVPIEEYTFFIVQPLMTGLWLLFLGRRIQLPTTVPNRPRLRHWAAGVASLVWLGSVAILISGWQAGTYLGLELVWALPPIMLQLIFGADILWHYRRFVLLALVPPTLYLSAADALAIQAGTWTINPAQSLPIHLGGILPLEEFVFFLLTNTLIVFGITLALSLESGKRFAHLRKLIPFVSLSQRAGLTE